MDNKNVVRIKAGYMDKVARALSIQAEQMKAISIQAEQIEIARTMAKIYDASNLQALASYAGPLLTQAMHFHKQYQEALRPMLKFSEVIQKGIIPPVLSMELIELQRTALGVDAELDLHSAEFAFAETARQMQSLGIAIIGALQHIDFSTLAVMPLQDTISGYGAALQNMSQSYASIWNDLAGSLVSATPAALLADVQKEMFCGVIGARSFDATAQLTEEENDFLGETDHVCEDIIPGLEDIHPNLVLIYRDGLAVLNGKNPERCSHSAVSIRRIIDEIVKVSVNKDKFNTWMTTKSKEEKSKCSNKEMKFRYLFRNIGSGNFGVFASANIDAVSSFYVFLNKQIHDINTQPSDMQVQIIKAWTPALLRTLILVARNETEENSV